MASTRKVCRVTPVRNLDKENERTSSSLSQRSRWFIDFEVIAIILFLRIRILNQPIFYIALIRLNLIMQDIKRSNLVEVLRLR